MHIQRVYKGRTKYFTNKQYAKGECHEIFVSGFLHQTTSPGPNRQSLKRAIILSSIRSYLYSSSTPVCLSSCIQLETLKGMFQTLIACHYCNRLNNPWSILRRLNLVLKTDKRLPDVQNDTLPVDSQRGLSRYFPSMTS